jgi:hypothetical protein
VIGFLNGCRLIADPSRVVDTGERSWARVRSPGRARRRLKRGFRQNIDVIWAPDPNVIVAGDMMIAHPAIIEKIRRKIEDQST